MIIKNKNYPHPVLAPFKDDIQKSPMYCNIEIEWDKSYYYLKYEFSVGNETIMDLINDSHAHLMIHIECGRTFYRKVYRIDINDFTGNLATGAITIPANNLKDKTEVSVFVCATSIITDYVPIRMHPDYGSSKFNLENGDFVAAWQTYKFDLYQDYDPIKKTDSIISFQRDMERQTGEISIILDSAKLTALLPKDIHQIYIDLCADKNKEDVIMAMLGVPILIEGLLHLKEITTLDEGVNLSAWRSKRWFRSLEKKLSDMKIDIKSEDSMFLVAQKIFENPCKKAGIVMTRIDNI